MKKSELKAAIKEEIKSALNEADPQDIQNQDAINKALETTKKMMDDINATEDSVSLAEADPEDVKSQEELNKSLEKTLDAAKELQSIELSEFKNKIREEIISVLKEDEEPTASQLSGDSVAVLAAKLQDTTSEMKSTANKMKKTEDVTEKEKLMDRLKTLNRIKKEIESMLE
jgi:hypothetical protein